VNKAVNDAAGATSPSPISKSIAADSTREWRDENQYENDAEVSHNGARYKCVAPHISHARLSPDTTPSIWATIEPEISVLGVDGMTEDPKWRSNQNYNLGDRVRYNGVIYACIQAHRSQDDWAPDLTPALWKAIDVTPPEPPKINAPVYRKRSLLLPVEADLKSIISASDEERRQADEKRRKEAEQAEAEADALLKKHALLKGAITELVRLSPEFLDVRALASAPAIEIDPKFGAAKFVTDQLEYRGALREIAITRAKQPPPTTLQASGITPTTTTTTAAAETPDEPKVPTLLEPNGAFNLAKELLSSGGTLLPRAAFKPVPQSERIPKVKQAGVESLSITTKAVLTERGLDLRTQPINGKLYSPVHELWLI
jgi:hypothetical protein